MYNKGYQETEEPYSSVTTKLKGVGITNLTGVNGSALPLYGDHFVWDSADYVVPPEVITHACHFRIVPAFCVQEYILRCQGHQSII